MRDRVVFLKKRLLDARPSLSAERVLLAKEAYIQYAGEAAPLFRARVFTYVLDHMTVAIQPGEMIVGNQSKRPRCVSFHPEYMSARWIHEHLDELVSRGADPFVLPEDERRLLDEHLPWWYGRSTEDRMETVLPSDVQQARRQALITVGSRTMPSSHTMPNYRRLLAEGLNGYIARCERLIAESGAGGKEAQEQINFRRAAVVACRSVIRFAARWAAAAEALAETEPDAVRRRELRRIAQNCRRTPGEPPRDFYEALQFVWFIHLMPHIETNSAGNGLGRFDQYMFPFYERDLAAGLLTRDDALELLQCFYIKTSELLPVRVTADAVKFAGYPMWQILMVGGVDIHGADATNDLSRLCLEAQEEARLAQPAIGMRVHERTPDDFFRLGLRMIRQGLANPAFFNDKVSIPICLAKGGTVAEARDWAVVGCIEPHPGGGVSDASPTAGYVNGLKCLELALHNGVDPRTGETAGPATGDPRTFTCRADLTRAVETQLRHCWDLVVKGYNLVVPHHMLEWPVVFSSLIMDDCIDKGKSIQEGGARYSYTGTFFCGAASVADSILGVDHAVFREKIVTMDRLLEVLAGNFAGEERLRQFLLNRAPKFGNDDQDADSVCRDLLVRCSDHVQQFTDVRGGRYCLSNLSQTLNVLYGEYCGATPDGRLSGEALSDNASPANGRDLLGPTATVNSVASLDQVNTYDGTLFNLRFDSGGSATGEQGLDIIGGVVKTYFANYGQHIQINVVDDATLRAAQRDPEHYRGLVVRVAGYLAYFTDLDRQVQENIIERTAHLKSS
ncbi:MAG: pyruvate formate-lyase [Gracilibacteraceae bacterium]|jgi:formate C-acetyltransferase|nr:pyruvate formate-lyase [Gracilibacteraceae bacterium]